MKISPTCESNLLSLDLHQILRIRCLVPNMNHPSVIICSSDNVLIFLPTAWILGTFGFGLSVQGMGIVFLDESNEMLAGSINL